MTDPAPDTTPDSTQETTPAPAPGSDPGATAARSRPATSGPLLRGAFLVAGLALVAVGFIGAFLPLLPSTVFFILAAACFARASPRLEAWLLAHRTIGPPLVAWRERGAIPRPAKIAAFAGVAIGFTLFEVLSRPPLWVAGIVAAALLAVLAWIASRPA